LPYTSTDDDLLGGVWQYHQAAERISLGGLDDEDESTDFTDDSALSTPMPRSGGPDFFEPFVGGEGGGSCPCLNDTGSVELKEKVCFSFIVKRKRYFC
jgi:hypothetical protein